MLAIIRGAGDIASAIALRLHKCGVSVIMTEVEHPLTVRRTVAFSEAVRSGKTQVEGVVGVRAESVDDALRRALEGVVPVLVDPKCSCIWLEPDVLVDAILAKRNVGTAIDMAPIVIGVGPGFTAGDDCHAVVETMRGHTLGRVIYSGSAIPNTNVPGLIGGFAGERVLRAPADGAFHSVHRIGDLVKTGDVAGYVSGEPMVCTIDGVLRGLIADGIPVRKGMKSGDVDPRGNVENCYTVSDKATAVGGGVLEAILHLSGALLED